MTTTGSSKWAVAFVAGAVLLIGIPRAVNLFQSDSTRQVLGSLLALAFFAWLVWRLYAQISEGWEQEPRFHHVSAAGYLAFVVLGLALVAWDIAQGDFRPVVLASLAFTALLAVSSLWSARLAARH